MFVATSNWPGSSRRGFDTRLDSPWPHRGPYPSSHSDIARRALADEAAVDRVNRDLLARVNEGGLAYLSPCEVRGRVALRFAIGAPATESRHVAEAWDHIARTASRCVPPTSAGDASAP